MKLYEIAEDYRNFMGALERGEIPEEAIADTLEAIEGDLDDKLNNTVCLYKSLLADAAAIKAEEQSLSERRKAKEAEAERIKDYISRTIPTDKWENARHKLSFRKSKKVVIADEAGFTEWAKENADQYLIFKEPTISKKAVGDALKANVEVPGAEIVEEQNLQIK